MPFIARLLLFLAPCLLFAAPALGQGDDATCAAQRERIHAAFVAHSTRTGASPLTTTIKDLVEAGALPEEPRCPAKGDYMIHVAPLDSGPVVLVKCTIHRGGTTGEPGSPGAGVTPADAVPGATAEAGLAAPPDAAAPPSAPAANEAAAKAPVDPQVAQAVCRMQRAQILAAANMLLMENESGPAPEITIAILVEKGLLQEPPACPGGGEYSVRVTENAAGGAHAVDVECSAHD